MTIAGLLIGFLVIQLVPLPRWRLLGALAAASCLMNGADLSAISSLNLTDPKAPTWMLGLGGGLLMGVAIGYFANWIRAVYTGTNASKTTEAEQDAATNP